MPERLTMPKHSDTTKFLTFPHVEAKLSTSTLTGIKACIKALSVSKLSSTKLDKKNAEGGDGEQEFAIVESPEVDAYLNLKYKSDEDLSYRGLKRQSWRTRSVYVKHPVTAPLIPAPARPALNLQLAWCKKDELLGVYNSERRKIQCPGEAFHRERGLPLWQAMERMKGAKRQRLSLQEWEKQIHLQHMQERNLAAKLQKPADALLMTRPLTLPPMEKHQERSHMFQHDFPVFRQIERSYNGDSFFFLPHTLGAPEREIACSLKWSERNFYKPPFSIVRPKLEEDESYSRFKVKEQDVSKPLIGQFPPLPLTTFSLVMWFYVSVFTVYVF